MKSVYKYSLDFEVTILKLPYDSEILSCGFQNRELELWALINPNEYVLEERCIIVLSTGQNYNKELKLKFIQTVFIDALVFHVFEALK